MDIIKRLQKELKEKINLIINLKESNEELEFYIFNLIERIRTESKNKYKLNMVYNN